MVNELLKKRPLKSNNITEEQLRIILDSIVEVHKKGIEGDIVELGCHSGLTSTYIQELLNMLGSEKKLHLYDSFQGLPEKQEPDIISEESNPFQKGAMMVSKWNVEETFRVFGLSVPKIYSGWFIFQQYPEKISFAFFDGDLYSSIIDSFKCTFDKVQSGGIICVHDYGFDMLPGVRRAVDEYLKVDPCLRNMTVNFEVAKITKC